VKRELVQRFTWGVPVYRQRFGGLASRPSTERFYRLMRACMAHAEQLRTPFEGALECDETAFGGHRKGKTGWGAAGKVLVFGIVKRNGQVTAQPIPAHDRASVMQVIEAHSREGSLYYTDDWNAYATLKLRGDHVVIRKAKGRPVGRDHIHQWHRGLLVVCQELAVSLPRRAPKPLPSVPRRDLLPLQPPRRGPKTLAHQDVEHHHPRATRTHSGPV
jgi:transposase-like protein